MNIKKFQDEFGQFYRICLAIGAKQGENYLFDVLTYVLFLMGQDSVLTANEANFIHEVLGIEKDEIAQLYKNIDWDHFQSNIPESLLMFIEVDKKVSCPYQNSTSRKYIDYLHNLGTTFIAIDGLEGVGVQAVKNYVDWITNHAKQALASDRPDPASIFANMEFDLDGRPKNDPNIPGNASNKNGKPQKDGNKSAGKETAKKPVAKGGNWIPMEEHIPSGNFLDDVFRHAALSHDDRVKIWKNHTKDSLPCVMLDDLEYSDFAWVGISGETNIDVDDLYDQMQLKDNKPIYYYTSGLKVMDIPLGMIVHHQGVNLVMDDAVDFCHWDQIEKIDGPINKNGSVCLELMATIENAPDFHHYICFGDNDQAEEITNLVKLMKIRLKQTIPFRDMMYMNEDPLWYEFVDEDKAKKLCEDYLQNKGAKPGKADKSQPPKPDKPAKQAEKKAETPKPQSVAPKPASKASGAVSIPTTGPTSKLDFWQAFKPYIDQMRHSEFSKVKIKDDDCLDTKATVIVGAYNSILMRVSKNLLRMELYIDTETEAGNLQILDYIKAKIQVPPALKGRIEYERKEGRRAQRVCVSFPGFELTNRSCWGKYITEIMSVADDFFDAVEAPMRELISGS